MLSGLIDGDAGQGEGAEAGDNNRVLSLSIRSRFRSLHISFWVEIMSMQAIILNHFRKWA